MPTRPGDQASPEQPNTSVSLLDDELMSLGEEGAGAGPGAGQAQLQVGCDTLAHKAAFRVWSGQTVPPPPVSPLENGGGASGPFHS